MTRYAWPTGASISPSSDRRAILIPDDQWIRNTILGALAELCDVRNWEQGDTGFVTPDEIVQTMIAIYQSWDGVEVGNIVGQIIMWPSLTPPDKHLFCEGQLLLKTDYPELFAITGIQYGQYAGTHFALPDLKGRVVVGEGTGTTLNYREMAIPYGPQKHYLTVGQLPPHTHNVRRTITPGGSTNPGFQGNIATIASAQIESASAGNGDPIDMTVPCLTMKYAICVEP